ncbi:MAG: hypothetical protein JJT76_10810 [Clostridiaceae bacterium]|nr:hypothetical protein [Clostridiaceae bacterium]
MRIKDRDRKLEVLLAIEGYIKKGGYSLTVREIEKLLGLRSTSTTQGHLVEMEIMGVIEKCRIFKCDNNRCYIYILEG